MFLLVYKVHESSLKRKGCDFMRDVKITITPNDDQQAATTKIISEIELGNIIDNSVAITETEETINILNDIISAMLDCIDSGGEYTTSDTITINPALGVFSVYTNVNEFYYKEIVKHAPNTEVMKFLNNEENIVTTSEFHFVLRKLKEVRTKLIKHPKMFEVEVFNTETKEYRKLSKLCSAYSITASTGLDLYKPCSIQIIDGAYKVTFKAVVRDLRKNVITSSIYRRKIEVCSLTEIIKDVIQSL